MDKIQLAKGAVAFVVGAATSKTVKLLITQNTTPDKVADKVAVVIATWILSGVVADAVKDWTDAQIDDAIAKWKKFQEKKTTLAE